MDGDATPTYGGTGGAVIASEIDLALTAQLAVAWAGEAGEVPRLGWWRSDLVSEFGGEDLFGRLLPHTWEWAVLQAAREAARRHDADLRRKDHAPDSIVSLYSLGFELDEHVEERLQDLKRSGKPPREALPGLNDVLARDWSRERFSDWVSGHVAGSYKASPIGRSLGNAVPAALPDTIRHLVAALAPLSGEYPLPHYRRPS
jgi:hypothetical protein